MESEILLRKALSNGVIRLATVGQLPEAVTCRIEKEACIGEGTAETREAGRESVVMWQEKEKPNFRSQP